MGHHEVKWSIVSSCCLHNRHLLSISFFKIIIIIGKVTVLWDVAWCSLVERGPGRGACCLNMLPLWKQKVFLQHWYCCTRRVLPHARRQ